MSWRDYSESLVERRRVLFDLESVGNWNRELDGMNREKGRPSEFPEPCIEFLPFFRAGLNAPYRVVEVMTEALSEYLTLVKEIRLTQIKRRVLAIIRKKKPSCVHRMESINDDPLTIIVDSTGSSTTKKESYIEEVWTKEVRQAPHRHGQEDEKDGRVPCHIPEDR